MTVERRASTPKYHKKRGRPKAPTSSSRKTSTSEDPNLAEDAEDELNESGEYNSKRSKPDKIDTDDSPPVPSFRVLEGQARAKFPVLQEGAPYVSFITCDEVEDPKTNEYDLVFQPIRSDLLLVHHIGSRTRRIVYGLVFSTPKGRRTDEV